ncbi:hypothetical protein [uncultured Desulfovibrio sp.]|uniref:hypothetical protein n=1 Tax=uncultured Desulfovibrio sp. TaxID=167968 RepID=UPI002634A569|nr:hypothetical protein [uncultured Desulfovibrio sp.]
MAVTLCTQGQVAVHHGLHLAVQLVCILSCRHMLASWDSSSRAGALLSQGALMEHPGPALAC